MDRTKTMDVRVRVFATTIFLLILAAIAVSPARASTNATDAELFIDDLARSGIAMLEASELTDTDREMEFRRLVRKGFALEAIGQFVAGLHWRSMSDDQRAEFQELFSEWVLTSYARRLGGYNGQKMEIIKSTELNNRAGDIVVQTQVIHSDGQMPISAAWRIRRIGGELKIIDVIVEGVSMAAAQRAEYDAVIRKIGVEGLLDNLRLRLAVMVAGG